MATMTLIQIPFSHNCVKVRVALGLKGLPYETENIPPTKRRSVFAASGQGLVPVLVDRGQTIADSTRILLHLEHLARERRLPLLRLETNKTLTEAQSLYRRNGFREVAAFNGEPYAHHWFEKAL